MFSAEDFAHILPNGWLVQFTSMTAMKRLPKEFAEMQDPAKCPPGVHADLVDGNMFHWKLKITGPAGTPYEGGIFNADLTFPEKFPFQGPTFKFQTKIYHPNVSQEKQGGEGTPGEMCLGEWAPKTKIVGLLSTVMGLLANPNTEHVVDAEIGREYVENRAEFNRKAKEWTAKYAK